MILEEAQDRNKKERTNNPRIFILIFGQLNAGNFRSVE
jgi:hypothetical protein